MSGNLTISLIEILAYLFPGGIVLAAVLDVYFPELGDRTLNSGAYQIAFTVCSYIIGHPLMLFSYLLVFVQKPLKKLARIKPPAERLYFYRDFRRRLGEVLGEDVASGHTYQFANRLITDNRLPASQVIDRLYAMVLFSRNITISFIVTSLIFSTKSVTASLILGGLALAFLARYIQMEIVITNTVFRAAYVYLFTQGKLEQATTVESDNA